MVGEGERYYQQIAITIADSEIEIRPATSRESSGSLIRTFIPTDLPASSPLSWTHSVSAAGQAH
jgi:hypothetical protein